MLISLTIHASEELESLFSSMIMRVDNAQHVFKFMDSLISTCHGSLNDDEHVELYAQDATSWRPLDTTLTLQENDIKHHDILMMKKVQTNRKRKRVYKEASELSAILPGENIESSLEGVYRTAGGISNPHISISGIFYITNYRIIWKPISSGNAKKLAELQIPHRAIFSLEKRKRTYEGASKTPDLYVMGRNFILGSFIFPNAKDARQHFAILKQHVFPAKITDIFCFANRETFGSSFDGWEVYKCEKEFTRIGLDSNWRICSMNHDFGICDIYPRHFVVPSSINDMSILFSTANREYSRIPLLVWKHPENHAVIGRGGPISSNSSTGNDIIAAFHKSVLGSRKCGLAALINVIELTTDPNQSPHSDSPEFVESTATHIFHPDNIIHDYLKLLHETVLRSPQSHFSIRGGSCAYLRHVRSILAVCLSIVTKIQNGTSTILQASVENGLELLEFPIISLSLILLDPYYRTITGFIVLIEKEWNEFAFPFCSFAKSNEHEDLSRGTLVPHFLLFLDCLWQIYLQKPTCFEYNEELLLFLADQSVFGRFGTFSCGLDREPLVGSTEHNSMAKGRSALRKSMKKRSVSAWNYVNFHLSTFTNPFYSPFKEVLVADTTNCSVSVWTRNYFKYVS